jgi:hypothetical protein
VWGASKRVFQKSSFIVLDFFHVAELLYVKCGDDDFRLFAEIARKIWMRRNAYIYEGTFTHPDGIVRDVERAVNEYEQVNKTEGQQSAKSVSRQVQWTKPEEGWLKVNVDAAVDKMGFGILLRDHEGKVLAAKCMMKMGVWESTAAEAMAAYHGIALCQERGVPNIILEGDAKQITVAILANGKNNSMLGPLGG